MPPGLRATPAPRVILVDDRDRAIGRAEKLDAHRDGGRLHRAFSVFLFDARGRMLLQQRAAAKYHFPLLWSNACCGHPSPGERTRAAARRRVREELGVGARLREVFSFHYVAEDPASGLTEREIDHVFVGRLSGEPDPAPGEVAAVDWLWPHELTKDVVERARRYTPWFPIALAELASRGLLAPRSAADALPRRFGACSEASG